MESKLRNYISTSVIKYDIDQYGKTKANPIFLPNDQDEIFNKKHHIDFNLFDIIAVKACLIGGINLNKKNVYEVRPTQEMIGDNVYQAVMVKSTPNTKPVKFLLMGGKPTPIVEQRVINEAPKNMY